MLERQSPVLKLAALAALLAVAACTTTDAPPPVARAPAAAAEPTPSAPTPSAYVTSLRSQGFDTATIPARGKFVLVNIPSYELIALQDGVPVLRSRVVVGKPAAPTPELMTSMYAVQFNPAWTPTPSMVRNESARPIPPGPQNPLGRMMFELDNDEFIYLHDTNEKGLFKREQRALSHGCIRVEQVRALAAWAMGVSEKEIDDMAARGTTHSVPLPEVIPVALTYHTRFPDAQGQLAAYPDIYADRLAAR